jgi:hypothetical protein
MTNSRKVTPLATSNILLAVGIANFLIGSFLAQDIWRNYQQIPYSCIGQITFGLFFLSACLLREIRELREEINSLKKQVSEISNRE